jgi:hypothetical protein
MAEQLFFTMYGARAVKGLLGINTGEKVQTLPGTMPEKLPAQKQQMAAYAAKLGSGGFEEALARAMLYVVSAERSFNEPCAAALGTAFRESYLRDQFFVLLTERERGVQALGTLLPEADKRATLLQRLNAIVGDPSPAEHHRISHLSQMLSVSAAKPTPAKTAAMVVTE